MPVMLVPVRHFPLALAAAQVAALASPPRGLPVASYQCDHRNIAVAHAGAHLMFPHHNVLCQHPRLQLCTARGLAKICECAPPGRAAVALFPMQHHWHQLRVVGGRAQGRPGRRTHRIT